MSNNSSLTILISTRTLEKIQDYFSIATNIGCVIRDAKGNPLTKFSQRSELWLEVSKHPEIEKTALRNQNAAMDKCSKTGVVEIYQHYIDAHAFIVPIIINNNILAYFVGGMTRFGNPNIEICAIEAEKLNIDLDTFLEMYLKLPLKNVKILKAGANLLRITARTLSMFAKEGQAITTEMSSIKQSLKKEIADKSLKLKHSEARYRNLFNTINDGIYIADLNGNLKDINAAGAGMLGYRPNEIIGRNLRDLYVDPASRDKWTRQLFRLGHIELFYPHIKLKNGQSKYFETNATIILDHHGKTIGIQGVFRDISQRNHKNITKKEIDVTSKPTIKNA